jgi:hypothetical protein
MFSLNLFATVRTKTSLMFQNYPVRCVLVSKTPNKRKDLGIGRNGGTKTQLNSVAMKQIIDFTDHVLFEGRLISIFEHSSIMEDVRISTRCTREMF